MKLLLIGLAVGAALAVAYRSPSIRIIFEEVLTPPIPPTAVTKRAKATSHTNGYTEAPGRKAS